MKIGFTGTRKGMTDAQKTSFEEVIKSLRGPSSNSFTFMHGACEGADEQAVELCGCETIIAHPCDLVAHLSVRAVELSTITLPVKPPLDRNKDIVDTSDLLIATPETEDEILRSGTWSTIRYARKRCRSIVIIYPDGKIMTEPSGQ